MKVILDEKQIHQFIQDGYICIESAFSKEIADKCLDILWKDTGLDRNQPNTWTQPVIRLGMYHQEPFIKAANTPVLNQAFDQLAGKDNWLPCMSMGSFPIRFPSATDAGDTGWHVDVSFPGDEPGNYFKWRANIRSRGRALLTLFLFSDVSIDDAPTRLLAGSHQDIARLLLPAGNRGLSFMEIVQQLPDMSKRKEVHATGKAGTVYLCHPFIVHAAQMHRGKTPKFMAQPPLLLKQELNLDGVKYNPTPIEQAVLQAIAK